MNVRLRPTKACPECGSKRFAWDTRTGVGTCRECGYETGEEEA